MCRNSIDLDASRLSGPGGTSLARAKATTRTDYRRAITQPIPADEFWTAEINERTYDGAGRAPYQQAVMEQYKLYVGLVQHNRSRRALANSFHLGLNTSAFVAIGALWQTRPHRAILTLVMVVLLEQCVSWAVTIQRYREIGAHHSGCCRTAMVSAESWTCPGRQYDSAPFS
jgi:hypothetical protein